MNTISFPSLGLEFNINPVAFSVGNWPVYWYGIIMAAAIIAASGLALFRAARRGMNGDEVIDYIIWMIVGGFIGARIYYVIFYGNWSEIFAIWHGGIAIYGGIIGGIIALFLKLITNNEKRITEVEFDKSNSDFKKTNEKRELFDKSYSLLLIRYSFLKFADLFAPALLLGQAIGRWGNFVNAEAYGGEYSGFWAMTINGQSVHPTFLYESAWCLVGLALILIVERYCARMETPPSPHLQAPKQDDGKFLPASVGPPPLSRGGTTRQSGLVFAMYVAWYGLGRFFIEGLRVDSLMLGNLRISQAIAALSFVVGMWFIYKLTKKEKSK